VWFVVQAVIAAAMSDKSPFVVPLGQRDKANSAKQALAIAASDHLTVYRAYLGYLSFFIFL
jgi:ATP-dependent RNA helicase DHX29